MKVGTALSFSFSDSFAKKLDQMDDGHVEDDEYDDNDDDDDDDDDSKFDVCWTVHHCDN